MARATRVLGMLLAAAAGLSAQDLKDDSFDKLFATVIPSVREQSWRKIPWHANFWDAVIEAQEKDKPILLWAMNGHPLACTAGNGVRYRLWVWSDPEVQELAKKFIAAADETNVILHQRGPEQSALWKKIGAQGHYKGPGQGIYVATPSGALLASTNQRDAKVAAETLRKGLAAWESMKPEERRMSGKPAPEPEGLTRLYPEGGLVLQAFYRDLPRKEGEVKGFWAGMWNQDFAWFTREEARSLVPDSRVPGASIAMPEKLARRLVKYHLVDNVRGATRPFSDESVKRAAITIRVSAVEGDALRLKIDGASLADEKGGKTFCGFDAHVRGHAIWDLKKEMFTSFNLLATGDRWGDNTLDNDRRDDLGAHPMGIAFRLAGSSDEADRVPPLFVTYAMREGYFK
jgi:hypothetical protein